MKTLLLWLSAPLAIAVCWVCFKVGVALWLASVIALAWYAVFLYIQCRNAYDPTTEQNADEAGHE